MLQMDTYFLGDIPNEIITSEITKYLTRTDIVELSSCNEHLQSLLSDKYWKNIYTKLDIPFLNNIDLGNDINYNRLTFELEDKILLNELDKVTETNSDVFIYACVKRYIEIIKILIKIPIIDPSSSLNNYKILKGLNLHKCGWALVTDRGMMNINNYSLIFSACLGYNEIVNLLLKCPQIDPTAIDNRTIRWTCRYGHAKVLKLLLNDGRVDPNVRYNYCIRESIKNNHLDVAKILLKSDRIRKTKHDNIINIVWKSIYFTDINVKIIVDDNYNIISHTISKY